jgi:hypothetical protein
LAIARSLQRRPNGEQLSSLGSGLAARCASTVDGRRGLREAGAPGLHLRQERILRTSEEPNGRTTVEHLGPKRPGAIRSLTRCDDDSLSLIRLFMFHLLSVTGAVSPARA